MTARAVSIRLAGGTALLAMSGALCAQDVPAGAAPEAATPVQPADGGDDVAVGPGITITAQRQFGTVETDIPVERELTAADVASYGASSIGDLLTALAPETGSARGRGGGRPVVLINGQRVSGFRELRDLPPEAIDRVQIYPEELALQYGYRPDQRVVNFILKPNFRSLSLEAGYGLATQGDFETNEIDATFTRIAENGGRLNLSADFEPTSRLLQSDRDIRQARTDSLGIVDEGRFRTLLPATDPLELSGSFSRNLAPRIIASLTGGYDRTRTLALLGLPAARFASPDGPVTRLFADGGGLRREGGTDAFNLASLVYGRTGKWRWTAQANYDRTLARSRTERQPDPGALVAAVAAGTADPLDPALTLPGPRTIDTTRSLVQTGTATVTASGSPLRLPAGEAQLTLAAIGSALGQRSRSDGRLMSTANLSRQSALARANLVLPVTSVREGFGDGIGDLSLNGNLGVSSLSDFGTLTEYGYGLTWKPVDTISLIASVIGEQAAPGLGDLGAPQQLTPNASVFDGRTGDTVLATLLTGGNPNLRRETRRDLKLSATWSPGKRGSKSFVVEYLANRSDDVTSGFPLLTPAIEAAFPDRVTRDAAGRLTQLDLRPVTFDRLRSDRFRFGFSLSGSLGGGEEGARGDGQGGGEGRARPARSEGSAAPARPDRPRTGGRRGRPDASAAEGAGTPPATAAAEPATATPAASPRWVNPMAAAGFGGRRRGGRWNLSLYDVWQLNSRVRVRDGVPELDLLGGDVTDGSTPIARHQVQLEGGVFKNGLGARLTGAYTSDAALADSGLGVTTGQAGSLRFGDLFTLSTRVFVNFDQREDALGAWPFLKGSRLSLRVDNLFGGQRRVVDPTGVTPLAYQPGFLDARGRFVEVSFRKRF